MMEILTNKFGTQDLDIAERKVVTLDKPLLTLWKNWKTQVKFGKPNLVKAASVCGRVN